MGYKRKTEDEFQIHGNYGYGFEEVTCEVTLKDARQTLKDYRENEPYANFKLIKKRLPIQQNS